MEVWKMIFRFHVSLRGGVFHHDSGSTFWGAWNHVMKGHAQSSCVCRMARRCHWLTHPGTCWADGVTRDSDISAWDASGPELGSGLATALGNSWGVSPRQLLSLAHWTSIFQALFKLRTGDFLGLPTSGRSKISNRIFSQNLGVFLPGLSWWLSTFLFGGKLHQKTPAKFKGNSLASWWFQPTWKKH